MPLPSAGPQRRMTGTAGPFCVTEAVTLTEYGFSGAIENDFSARTPRRVGVLELRLPGCIAAARTRGDSKGRRRQHRRHRRIVDRQRERQRGVGWRVAGDDLVRPAAVRRDTSSAASS